MGTAAGATNVEFGLLGEDWRWGGYRLERLVAAGVADSNDGVSLEELSVAVGPAQAVLRGSLLCDQQDAQLSVTHFPLDLLQPLSSALPPAVQGGGAERHTALRPFTALTKRLDSTLAALGLPLIDPAAGGASPIAATLPIPRAADLGKQLGQAVDAAGLVVGASPAGQAGGVGAGGAVGPVSGNLFISGHLGGGTRTPEVELDVYLANAAINSTRLSVARAHASVDRHQLAQAQVELQPAEQPGFLRLAATAQLPSVASLMPSRKGHSQAAAGDSQPAQGQEAGAKGQQGQRLHTPFATPSSPPSHASQRWQLGQQGQQQEEDVLPGSKQQAEQLTGQRVGEQDLVGRGESGQGGAAQPSSPSGQQYSPGPALLSQPGEGQQHQEPASHQLPGPGQDSAAAPRPADTPAPAPPALPLPSRAASWLRGLASSGPSSVSSPVPGLTAPSPESLGLDKAGGAAGAGGGGHPMRLAPGEELDVRLQLRDGGTALLAALLPGCEWQGGSVWVDVRAHGGLAAPLVVGQARVNQAALACPGLRSPVSGLTANMHFDGRQLVVEGVEARAGRQGRLRARGRLPLTTSFGPPQAPPLGLSQQSDPEAGQGPAAPRAESRRPGTAEQAVAGGEPAGLLVEADNLELRVNNLYTGQFDASLSLSSSLQRPHLGGWLRFSKGTLSLLPPSSPSSPSPSPSLPTAATASSKAPSPMPTFGLLGGGQGDTASPVAAAFALLKAGRHSAALAGPVGPTAAAQVAAQLGLQSSQAQHPPGSQGGGAAAGPPLQLWGLRVVLGPEFRAFFPVVLNMGLSGQVVLHGPADPAQLRPSGVISLDSGTLNLVATQFSLDRERPNRLLLSPESGLDPWLDLALTSGDLRATVLGRGSAWQDSLSLSASGTPLVPGAGGPPGKTSNTNAGAGAVGQATGAGPGGLAVGSGQGRGRGVGPGEVAGVLGGVGLVEAQEVARVFEERLAEALLGDNGQLALRSLASSTFSTLLPKIESHGQLGAARWRLVGAPSLPNLLGALDPLTGPGGEEGVRGAGQGGLDPAKFLSSLAVGTELELVWGSSLTAALSHKLLADGKVGTEATLTYRITDLLRLQLQLQGMTRPSLLLGYTSSAL
ncbi:hypothetical protein V8C86DRAFT_606614 [Haematococcus lacustris]